MILKRNLSIIVCAALAFGLISTAIAKPVQGKSNRVAVITDLTGSASVKSSGGSQEYDAYVDMGLNEGDYITTDDDSSITLKIKDHDDEMTFGSNSVVSLTTLSDKGKGKKSKIKMWAGSLWSSVKKLGGGDDYEVETPTAVMAVRGTKVLTSVNPETGETYVAVAAGTVSANTNSDKDTNNNNNTSDSSNKKTVLIAPSQQLTLDSRSEVDDLENKVAIIDPDKLVSESSSKIIEAIVKDKQGIDQENAEFIASQKDKIGKKENTDISRGDANSSLKTSDLGALDKVSKNLDNLIGNVVKSAIDSNKVDKDKINKIIDDINKQIDDPSKKLDLSKVVPLDKTAGVDAALQKTKDAELKKLDDFKKVKEAEKKQQDDANKQKLAEALKQLAAEAARIEKEKEPLGLTKPTPIPVPVVVVPTPTSPPVNSTPASTPTPSVDVAILSTLSASPPPYSFNVVIKNKNFAVSEQVYGIEVHVVYKTPTEGDYIYVNGTPTSNYFITSGGSVNTFRNVNATTNTEIIYAAVIPATSTVTEDGILAKLPIAINANTNKSFDVYVKVVRIDGSSIVDRLITPVTFTP
jgi:hypothetical protein